MINKVEIEIEACSPHQSLSEYAPVLLVGICSDREAALVTPLAESSVATALAELAKAAGFEGKPGQVRTVAARSEHLPGTVVLVGLGERAELDRLTLERAYGLAMRQLRGGEFPALVALPALEGEFSDSLGAVVDAVVLGSYTCATYLNEEEKKKAEPVRKVFIPSQGEPATLQQIVDDAKALAEGTNIARDVANAPGADLTPPAFADAVAKLAKEAGLQAEIWKTKRIAAHGMNLLLAVGQGSANEPRFVKLTYKPEGRTQATIVLVGKGITFDSGGISLKKPEGMDHMKGDKAGAAAVVGTLLACTKLKPQVRVIGLLAMAENMPSNKSYKPGDVFTSAAGKTVEVLDTDAEGRLVLADALHYATTLGADAVIDLATLTGSCIVGLGPQVAGLFSNDEALAESILQSSDEAGERLWPLPLDPIYRTDLDSETADIKNVGGRYGDAVHAALFLREFVGEARWAHLDIAGPSWVESAPEPAAAGATGYGVRLLGNFLRRMGGSGD